MFKVQITAQAKIDLEDVWQYTFNTWSKNQADKYFNGINDRIKIIAQNPFIGIKYHDILPGLFGSVYKSHIIFYEIISKKEARIVRVLHKKMDYSKRFL